MKASNRGFSLKTADRKRRNHGFTRMNPDRIGICEDGRQGVEYAFQAYRNTDRSTSPASAAEVNLAEITSAAKAARYRQPRSCTPEAVLHPFPASAFLPGGAA